MTPRRFLSRTEATAYVKSEWLKWIVKDELARKTYLFEQPRQETRKYSLSGTWAVHQSGYAGPLVLQMETS